MYKEYQMWDIGWIYRQVKAEATLEEAEGQRKELKIA